MSYRLTVGQGHMAEVLTGFDTNLFGVPLPLGQLYIKFYLSDTEIHLP